VNSLGLAEGAAAAKGLQVVRNVAPVVEGLTAAAALIFDARDARATTCAPEQHDTQTPEIVYAPCPAIGRLTMEAFYTKNGVLTTEGVPDRLIKVTLYPETWNGLDLSRFRDLRCTHWFATLDCTCGNDGNARYIGSSKDGSFNPQQRMANPNDPRSLDISVNAGDPQVFFDFDNLQTPTVVESDETRAVPMIDERIDRKTMTSLYTWTRAIRACNPDRMIGTRWYQSREK
jgi:hypothetical protein